jgi:hypothetical protein
VKRGKKASRLPGGPGLKGWQVWAGLVGLGCRLKKVVG